MTRRLAVGGFALLVAIVLALLAWWLSGGRGAQPVSPQAVASSESPLGESTEAQELTLYFPNGDGRLAPEARLLPASPAGTRRVEAALAAILEGPRTPESYAPFPEGVALERVQLGQHGVLYVGFGGSPEPPAAGSDMEILRVWSVVNTALVAMPSATSVVLTWNGEQRESWGGHVDTGRPLNARPELVVPSP